MMSIENIRKNICKNKSINLLKVLDKPMTPWYNIGKEIHPCRYEGDVIMEYLHNLVVLSPWARKDKDRPPLARNLYKVLFETDKAVKVKPIGYDIPDYLPAEFWAPKKAVVDMIDVHGSE